MKYNIRKLQQGGLASFTPILKRSSPGAVQPQNTESGNKKEGILDDDIYKKLISEGGLVNDVNLFAEQLKKLESNPLGFGSQGNIMSTYSLIGKVNELIRNKKTHDAALSEAASNHALNEVAVDSYGNMYTMDNGSIGTIKISEFKNSKDKPHVLTVAELMNHREFSKELAMNTSLFEVAKNAAGMDSVTDRIRQMASLMKEFSTESENHYSQREISQQMEALGGVSKPTKAQIEAFQSLHKLSNISHDFFKVVSKDSKNGRDLSKTLDYIYGTLNRNQQLKLEAVAAMNGDKSAKEYIFDMLRDYEGIKTTLDIVPQNDPSGKTGSGSPFSNMENLTPFQLFHKGKLADYNNQFNINNPGAEIKFRGLMSSVGALYSEKGDTIPMTTLDVIMKGFGLNRILQSGNIQFGDQAVDSYDTANIIYDGEDVAQVMLPTNPDGTVDLESMDEFKDIYALYDANKNSWSKGRAEKHFSDYGYNIKIDEDESGEKIIRNNSQVKPFLLMYGYTNDATKLVKDNKLLEKLSKEERKLWLPRLERIWTIGTGKNTENLTPDKSWHREQYYKGPIMIPYRKEATAYVDAIIGKGPLDYPSTIMDAQRNLRFSSNVPMNQNVGAKILTNNGN